MKVKNLLACIMVGALSVHLGSAQTMKVEGLVEGLGNAYIRFIKYEGNRPVQEDSIQAIDGRIKGELHVQSSPEKRIMYVGRFGRWIWAEEGVMRIVGDSAYVYNLAISGTKTQDEANVYDRMMQERSLSLQNELETRGKSMSQEELRALYAKFDPVKKEVERAFVKQYPNSFFSLDIVANGQREHAETVALFESLNPALRESKMGKQVAHDLTIAGRSAQGQQILSFTRDDVHGNPVAMDSFRGQYVLIDFWASWCVPCREENPNVLAAYRKYKDKGFTVLGVSIDDSVERWKKAIEEDKLPWTQVRDRKDKHSELLDYYGIMGVPTTFLVDPNGVIIGQNLRGDALEKKLAEVFGEN